MLALGLPSHSSNRRAPPKSESPSAEGEGDGDSGGGDDCRGQVLASRTSEPVQVRTLKCFLLLQGVAGPSVGLAEVVGNLHPASLSRRTVHCPPIRLENTDTSLISYVLASIPRLLASLLNRAAARFRFREMQEA